MDKHEKVVGFCDRINKELRKSQQKGRIDLGSKIQACSIPKISTGILGMDYALSGGIPRGLPVQLWGGFSSAKTTTALYAIKTAQKSLGASIAIASPEPFSKDWARKLGVKIPYSEKELEILKKKDKEEALKIEKEQKTWPDFVLLQHFYGDALLEMVYQAVKSNLFDIVLVDSLGAIQSYTDTEERSLEDQKYGGSSGLFSRFAGKIQSAFNSKYDPETMEPTVKDNWVSNQTAVIIVNQVRVKIGGFNPTGNDRHKAPGGEHLKHFWGASLYFSAGERHFEEGKNKKKLFYGQSIRINCDKCKIGAPFRTAEWDFYFEDHKGHKAGEVDTVSEILNWSIFFEFIQHAGKSYTIEGEKFVGNKKALRHLRKNKDLQKLLYNKCLTKIIEA